MSSEGALLKATLLDLGVPLVGADRLVRFWELVQKENGVQNLTCIIEPVAFAEEHLRDSIELIKTGWIQGEAVDLGTGGGFPGIPCAILGSASWILIDSEKRKIDFVQSVIKALELTNARAIHGRAEAVLAGGRHDFVVSRAVGPVERIYGWLSKCSTWNNLVLLKGPRWDEEWAAFQGGAHRNKLQLKDITEYEVGSEKKKRKIVWLSRI